MSHEQPPVTTLWHPPIDELLGYLSSHRKESIDYAAMDDHPLVANLLVAVPIRISELVALGGPNDAHYDLLPVWAEELGSHGDDLLFGGKKGEAARMFRVIVDVLAVLSFAPGGVSIFGLRFEGKREQAHA